MWYVGCGEKNETLLPINSVDGISGSLSETVGVAGRRVVAVSSAFKGMEQEAWCSR